MDETNKAVPPAPMPQDKRGWRVAPAPDGRGLPDEPKPRPPHRWRGFWILVAVVLAINWASLLMVRSSGEPRIKVPFSPYFLHQVEAGQVKVDLLAGRHDHRHVREEGRLPVGRQGQAHDAFLHPSSHVLG
jgi:hypothetical protein